jgi:putative ABC transport system permease protein
MSAARWLFRHLVVGQVRRQRVRTAVEVLAIAAGVALGFGVNLVNDAALREFGAATRELAGSADLRLAGSRDGFPEGVFGGLAASPLVRLASPVLEVRVPVVGAADGESLTIVGIDWFRAAPLTPGLLPQPAGDGDASGDEAGDRNTTDSSSNDDGGNNARGGEALLDDGLFLTPAATTRLRVAVGDTVTVQAGGRAVLLRVAGTVPGLRDGEVLGVMDIAAAQWRLDRLGVLTRIDLALVPGADAAALAATVALPAGTALVQPDIGDERLANLSRAYRVNLNVLALVALFTGIFLVFSLEAQATLARRTELAALRVLGVTRGGVARLVLGQAALVGAMGSGLGLGLGALLATAILAAVGGDLGNGGNFGTTSTARPSLPLVTWPALGFFVLGLLAAVLGALVPARDVARVPPAAALKAGAEEDAFRPILHPGPGLALLALAALLVALPPAGGIAIAAYAGIAALLVGCIVLQPWLSARVFGAAARRLPSWPGAARYPLLGLAVTRAAQGPSLAAIGMAGIVASFALMIAMATMVASFRTSLDDWLGRVLPADVYARAGGATTNAVFAPEDVATFRSFPGVARAEFTRAVRVSLAPDQPDVYVLAKPVDPARASFDLPLVGATARAPAGGPPPCWVSEAVVRLYGARVGGAIALPLAGADRTFFIAGVTRDYARQWGSVVVRDVDYLALTGDESRTEAALWLAPGVQSTTVLAGLRTTLAGGAAAEFSEAGELRALSLRIFDRSFTVTYVLEAIAILIGLVGVGATFAAQALARGREFAMLRHLGVTRRQVLQLLALEGALVSGLAIAGGLVAGLLVALVLVAVVNPQSFNWTMEYHVPGRLLATLAAVLLAAAVATAVIAGRRVAGRDLIRAVSADW